MNLRNLTDKVRSYFNPESNQGENFWNSSNPLVRGAVASLVKTQNITNRAERFGAGAQKGVIDIANQYAQSGAKISGIKFKPLQTQTPSIPSKSFKVGEFGGKLLAETAPSMLLGGRLAAVAKPAIGAVEAQASRLIAKGGAKKLAGKVVGNVAQGLPYTASYNILNKARQPEQSLARGVGTDIAFDVATAGLPLLGFAGFTKPFKSADLDILMKNIDTAGYKGLEKDIKKKVVSELENMLSEIGGVSRVGNARISANPKWYREFFSANKQAPSNKDMVEMAVKRVVKTPKIKIPTGADLDVAFDLQEAVKKTPSGPEPLLEKAKKYKSVEEFVKGQGYQGTYSDVKGLSPDTEVTVYRGVGKSKGGEIIESDWVTQNRYDAEYYAKERGRNDPLGWKILKKKVKAGELFIDPSTNPGVDNEMRYIPSLNKKVSQLTDIYNQAKGGNRAMLTEPPVKGGLSSQSKYSSDIPSSEGIIPVGKRLEKAKIDFQKETVTRESKAVRAAMDRDMLNGTVIKDINTLKRVSRFDKYSKGDVETYRKNLPEITNNVIEAIRENPRYVGISDSEALEVALSLPKKTESVARGVDTSEVVALTRELKLQQKKWNTSYGNVVSKSQFDKSIREWEKSLDDIQAGITRHSSGAVSVEPSFKTKQGIKQRIFDDREREFADFIKEADNAIYGKRTSSQALNDLAKTMDKKTDEGLLRGADMWKDKPKLSYVRETMERNFEDVMGRDAPIFREKLLDPVFHAEANRNKFLNKERADIKELGIKARSKESKLLQLFGEKKITIEQLKSETKEYDKIIKAESVLRRKYDSYIEQLNKVLTRNGYDPVPKRKDYFHHFQDIDSAFGQVGVALKAEDLPTDINGLTADFKPGRSFFAATLERKGDKTSIDAITGIDRYLEGASKQIYHTNNIKSLRAFEESIRQKYSGTNHLSNFVAELSEYTNNIAGKKVMVDRAAESVLGRKIYAGANALKSQVGSNMVGANVSSALTNFIPVTQTLATTNKVSVAQAVMSIIRNVGKDDGFVSRSDFLTSRLGSDRLSMNSWQKVGKSSGWLFSVIDNFTSQLAVRSKYLENIGRGLSEGESMRLANDWGRKTLGGRSLGEVPTLFNSKTVGFLTQFQLEVNNQISFMAKDIPRAFSKKGAASALGQLFIYSYIYNNIFEKISGRRPAFDPIGISISSIEDYQNENMEGGQATKRLIRNVSDNLPFTSTLTGGRIPIGAALPNVFDLATGESTIKKEMTKPLFFLLPPTGGGQIKKTLEGVGAYNRGFSLTDSGKIRFPIKQDASSRIKTSLFGQYSVPEAKEYFNSGSRALSEKQTSSVLKSKDPQLTYKFIIGKREASKVNEIRKDYSKGNITKEEAIAKINEVSPVKYEESVSGMKKTLVNIESFAANPVTTIKLWQKGEPIRKVRLSGDTTFEQAINFFGAITVSERATNLAKLDKGDKSTQVDHIKPKWLGGREDVSNYQILTNEEHAKKTELDNKLLKSFEAGDITKEEAWKQMESFNNSLNGKKITGDQLYSLAIETIIPKEKKTTTKKTIKGKKGVKVSIKKANTPKVSSVKFTPSKAPTLKFKGLPKAKITQPKKTALKFSKKTYKKKKPKKFINTLSNSTKLV